MSANRSTMSQREKITIREVAAAAGVSVMTVSRVLRNEEYVTQEKRLAVQTAIKTLGYVPLASARNLASSVTHAIGLLVPNEVADIEDKTGYEYLSALHLGALGVCVERNYALVLVNGHRPRSVAEKLVGAVRSRQIGGFVIPAPATEIPGLFKTLNRQEVPFAAISPLRPEHAPRWVSADERPAVRAMTQRLIEQGHREIAFAGGAATRAGVERLAGFSEAMAAAGIAIDERYVGTVGFSFDAGLLAGRKLLAFRRRPSAIVCANDDVAAGVLAVAHEWQLTLPEELSVVGFDNADLSRKTWPALTTVNLPVAEMAASAVRQVIGLLEPGGEPVEPTGLLACELCLRDSVTAVHATSRSPRAAR
jgi:LacI family transcriptional regulator